MYARVFHAFADTSPARRTQALLDCRTSIREQGVPLILTDRRGFRRRTRTCRSTPRATPCRQRRSARARVRRRCCSATPADRRPADREDLLRRSAGRERGSASFRCSRLRDGASSCCRRLLRHSHARRRGARASLGRDGARIGAPARNAALQPVRLGRAARGARDDDMSHARGHSHMRGDLERLDRVAHRFERIGREPKFEPIDVAAIVERIDAIFSGARSDAGQHDRGRDRRSPRTFRASRAIPSCSSGRSRF